MPANIVLNGPSPLPQDRNAALAAQRARMGGETRGEGQREGQRENGFASLFGAAGEAARRKSEPGDTSPPVETEEADAESDPDAAAMMAGTVPAPEASGAAPGTDFAQTAPTGPEAGTAPGDGEGPALWAALAAGGAGPGPVDVDVAATATGAAAPILPHLQAQAGTGPLAALRQSALPQAGGVALAAALTAGGALAPGRRVGEGADTATLQSAGPTAGPMAALTAPQGAGSAAMLFALRAAGLATDDSAAVGQARKEAAVAPPTSERLNAPAAGPGATAQPAAGATLATAAGAAAPPLQSVLGQQADAARQASAQAEAAPETDKRIESRPAAEARAAANVTSLGATATATAAAAAAAESALASVPGAAAAPAEAGLGAASVTGTAGTSASAAATAAPAFAAATAPPPPVRQLAEALPRRAGEVEIRLAPEELGKVRMVLHTHHSAVSLVVTAERAETADLLRRHADDLMREMAELGYDSVDLTFTASGGEGGFDQGAAEHEPPAETLPPRPAPAIQHPESDPAATPAPRSTTGLDLRL